MKHTFKTTISLLLCLFMLLVPVLVSCDTEDYSDGIMIPSQSTPAATEDPEDTCLDTTKLNTENFHTEGEHPPSKDDNLETFYTEELEFLPLGNGDAYAVSCGAAKMLTSIVIPKTYKGKPVTTIASNAFKECVALEQITLPNSILDIREKAFYKCANLKSINFPDSVKVMGNEAFYGCTSLTTIYIPSSIEKLGKKCFFGCISLECITFNAKLCADFASDDKVFCGFGYTNTPALKKCQLIIGSSVERIPNWCFSFLDGGSYLSNGFDFNQIIFENGCRTIGEFALAGNDICASIALPQSLTTIEARAFQCDSYNSLAVSTLIIPKNVKKIDSYAFYNWNSLTQIKFDGTVEDWNAIQKGKKIFNFNVMRCQFVQCSNGRVYFNEN